MIPATIVAPLTPYASSPAFPPLSPPAPAPAPAPMLAPALAPPSAPWSPQPPSSYGGTNGSAVALDEPPPRRGGIRAWVVALVVLLFAVASVGAFVLWSRRAAPPLATTKPATTRPVPAAAPSTRPSSTASASAVAAATPPASAVASATPRPSATARPTASASTPPAPPDATSGTITVPPGHDGHRVFVDGRVVGESPGTFTVRCGWRTVRVGSQGTQRSLSVPCGGDVKVQ